MKIHENVSLKKHSTMRLGGAARYLATVKSREDIAKAYEWSLQKQVPVIMIGQGSNIVWGDQGFSGLVLVNELKGFKKFKKDDGNTYITVGSGEVWDDVVHRSVRKGLSGIECLSLIPGTAGATPVQNVGAYGQEISQTLVSLEAYDTHAKAFVNIPKIDCHFGYRSSRFNREDKNRYFITALTLHLSREVLKPPFYASLQSYLDEHKITDYSPKVLRDAVIEIRSSKLPDPKKVANNGSFFANPVISKQAAAVLLKRYPNLAHWDQPDGTVKVSAAWLIEAAGFKDFSDPETGMATWHSQPLVLVNVKAPSTRSLIEFRQKIIVKVRYMFGITLVQEPELIGGL